MMLREQRAVPLPALSFRHDDLHHKLLVNDRLIALSHGEYVLVLALVQQRERYAQGIVPLCLDLTDLSQILGSSPETVQRLLSKANGKLLAQDYEVVCLYTHGYAIFHRSELVPDLSS